MSSSSSSSSPLSSTVVQYVSFAEHLLSALCQLVTATTMSRLLFFAHFRHNRLRVKGLSPIMHLYLITHCLFSILGLPYLLYKLIWWMPYIGTGANTFPYSPYVLFWTGLFELSYVTISPIPVIFLCIERSLTLKMAEAGTYRMKALLFTAGTVTIFIAWLGSCFGYLIELPLDLEKVSQCMLMSCQLIKLRATIPLFIKMVFGIIAILCCSVFLFMLSRFGMAANLKNRIVKWTIIAEILFDVLPGSSTFAFNKATGINVSNYIGEWATTLCALDACICALAYWATMVKRPGNANQSGNGNSNGGMATEQPNGQQKAKTARPTSIWITPVS